MPSQALGEELSRRVPSPVFSLGGGKGELDPGQSKAGSESSSLPCPRAAALPQAHC